MTKEAYSIAIEKVIELSGCIVNNVPPDAKRIAEMNLEALFSASKRHMLSAITGYALDAAGVSDERFTQEKGKAIRKEMLMENEKRQFFASLEKEGIWYMPLKGAVLKDLYPKIGMRQMADYDILIDPAKAEEVRRILERLGFTTKFFGVGNHDVYYKMPVCNFEIHTKLFGEGHNEKLAAYYRDVKERLVQDHDGGFAYHFSPEDFYIYMIAHEYKHFSGSGTGLRSVLDTYVFWLNYGDALDKAYLNRELMKLGLAAFEAEIRSLALHLFGEGELTEHDQEMLSYIIFSGTYGTIDNRVKNQLRDTGESKLLYMVKRFSVPVRKSDKRYASFAGMYPVFYRYRILLPLLPFYRIGRSVRSGRFRGEARAIRKA